MNAKTPDVLAVSCTTHNFSISKIAKYQNITKAKYQLMKIHYDLHTWKIYIKYILAVAT